MICGTSNSVVNVINAALIVPGDPLGTLTILGNYTQTATGVLVIQIAGSNQYGRLVIAGRATLDGTLVVSLLDNYVPAVGTTFQILTFAEYTGGFTRRSVWDCPPSVLEAGVGQRQLDVNGDQLSRPTPLLSRKWIAHRRRTKSLKRACGRLPSVLSAPVTSLGKSSSRFGPMTPTRGIQPRAMTLTTFRLIIAGTETVIDVDRVSRRMRYRPRIRQQNRWKIDWTELSNDAVWLAIVGRRLVGVWVGTYAPAEHVCGRMEIISRLRPPPSPGDGIYGRARLEQRIVGGLDAVDQV